MPCALHAIIGNNTMNEGMVYFQKNDPFQGITKVQNNIIQCSNLTTENNNKTAVINGINNWHRYMKKIAPAIYETFTEPVL